MIITFTAVAVDHDELQWTVMDRLKPRPRDYWITMDRDGAQKRIEEIHFTNKRLGDPYNTIHTGITINVE